MPAGNTGVVKYKVLPRALDAISKNEKINVFLICGDTFLVGQAFDSLVNTLLDPGEKKFALEVVDGKTTPVGELAEQAGTFSFLCPKKVIALKNAPLFAVKVSAQEISYTPKDMDILTGLIEKGLPENHVLIITTDAPDRRKKIYKTIMAHGLVVDCTVATGARKADIDEQQAVLKDISFQMLSKTGKKMDPDAFAALVDQTGFNPQIFANAIEKLAAYVGGGTLISSKDVRAVVHKDKKDPIFTLTNAVMDRDAGKALTLLSGLFANEFHPLQILKTLENQVRKLLAIKSFTAGLNTGRAGRTPLRSLSYNSFTQMMLPAFVDQDAKNLESDQVNQGFFLAEEGKKGKKTGSKAPVNDLLLAPNPKNAYPIFQNFLKSENFTLEELTTALTTLADLDYQIKSSGADAVTGLESFIMGLCRKDR